MIPKYNFRRPEKILWQKTYNFQTNQSKNWEIVVQNLSWKIFFQEQVKFLKLGIWFQFYNTSNKDTFFFCSPSTQNPLENIAALSKFLADYSPLAFFGNPPPGFKPSGACYSVYKKIQYPKQRGKQGCKQDFPHCYNPHSHLSTIWCLNGLWSHFSEIYSQSSFLVHDMTINCSLVHILRPMDNKYLAEFNFSLNLYQEQERKRSVGKWSQHQFHPLSVIPNPKNDAPHWKQKVSRGIC